MGDMDWGDVERVGHLEKFFIKMLVFLRVISIIVVAVIFLRPKKEYYEIGVAGETYCIPHLTGEVKYESGKTITISAEDIPRYAFRNYTLNGEVVSTEAEYTFVVKKETSGTYIANYEAIDYSVRMLGIYGTFSVTPTANVCDLIEIKDIKPNEGYKAGRAYYTLDTNSEEITIVNNKLYMPAGVVNIKNKSLQENILYDQQFLQTLSKKNKIYTQLKLYKNIKRKLSQYLLVALNVL